MIEYMSMQMTLLFVSMATWLMRCLTERLLPMRRCTILNPRAGKEEGRALR